MQLLPVRLCQHLRMEWCPTVQIITLWVPFSFGTEAYFSCDVGFSLVGSETRSCGDGNMTVGEFNGTAPACEGIIFHNT